MQKRGFFAEIRPFGCSIPVIFPHSTDFQSDRWQKLPNASTCVFSSFRVYYGYKDKGGLSHERGIRPNFITLTDEDGNDIELEYVDALELDGQTYMAFFPVVEDDADEEAAEEYGLVILKSVMENGEELLSTLDSDEELDKVYDLFMEQILSDEDE